MIKFEYIDIDRIKPYPNNPRINNGAVEAVANSIREFGFLVPVVVDKNNVLAAGHTRLKAAERLGIKSIPAVRADDLTEEQIRAFRLADNKTQEQADWDWTALEAELNELNIDMTQFGFEEFSDFTLNADDIDRETHGSFYDDERERTFRNYHLEMVDFDRLTNDFWQMPVIEPVDFIPTQLIGFKYCKQAKDFNTGVHFYIDDYQFERIWKNPEQYIDLLKQFECILTPDWSLYMDMSMPIKIYNVYRSRLIGQFYQNQGIKVIPTLSWAEEETFQFCFQGLHGGTVSVSTMGVHADEDAQKIWRAGMTEAIRQIEPERILVYGGEIEDFDFQGVNVLYYDNHIFDEYKEV